MAVQTRAAFQSLVTSSITDGGANTAAEVRTLLTNLSDSAKFNEDIDTLAELNALIGDATLGDTTADGRSLISAATYAAMRALLDLEAGTDFYSIAAADAAFATAAQGTDRRSPLVTVAKKSGNYTAGTDDADEMYGGIIYVSGAATITLPAVATGMSVTVATIGAVAVSVDPNASDLIYLDGTALDDGDKITNTSTAGDLAVLTYYDATGWYAATNSWTDGGA